VYILVAIDDDAFEWDENKRQANLVKHKLDLLVGTLMFDGRSTLTYSSPRGTEDRWVTIGLIEDLLLALVWTERKDTIRLISLRRARDAERRQYQARFCH
jgi:uncharacterized DUF497 family protein